VTVCNTSVVLRSDHTGGLKPIQGLEYHDAVAQCLSNDLLADVQDLLPQLPATAQRTSNIKQSSGNQPARLFRKASS